MRQLRKQVPVKYSPSKTQPGQALIPAELLKRHLAGTLPDIAKRPLYTYDENGDQISEDLSHLELHELHDLTLRMRDEWTKREKELAQKEASEQEAAIIEKYKASLKPEDPTPPADPAAPEG